MQDQENQAVPPNPEAAAAASAPPSTPEAGLPSLEEQLAATEAKLAEMHDAFMRAKADGENIRRRARKTWPRPTNSPSKALPKPWCR
jgi:molecular chaperone GrpE